MGLLATMEKAYRNGQLLGTVSESELNRKVGGFPHDPKIELAQKELNQETVCCFEDKPSPKLKR
jgi:hypothetical protein